MSVLPYGPRVKAQKRLRRVTKRRRWEMRMSVKAVAMIVTAFVLSTGLPVGVSVPAVAENSTCSSDPGFRAAQPVDNGVLKVGRIAGADATKADRWDMAFDTWWCNPTSSTYTVSSATVTHLNSSGGTIRTRTPELGASLQIDPGPADDGYVRMRETGEAGQFPFPLPASIRVSFSLSETGAGSGPSSLTVAKTYGVAEHENPKGGYFPPFRQADLPADAYWSQKRHSDSNYQRWAYDLGVERWTGAGWTHLKPGGLNTISSDSMTWDRPVYAASDGEIIGCNRGANDNMVPSGSTAPETKAVGNVPGGNVIWLRTGNETTLYAHLKKNSIPFALCPFSDDAEHRLANPNADPASDAPYRVKAGDLLGRTGNSGSSTSGPHLHIHTFLGLPEIWGSSDTERGLAADSRPMRFFNARVQPKAATDVAEASWNVLDPAAQLPYHTRAEMDPCRVLSDRPDDVEEARIEVPGRCFPDHFNTMRYFGMRPVHIDVTEQLSGLSYSMVWRRATGVGWSFHYGLSEENLRTIIFGSTMRVLEIESYTVGTALRFALIMVNDPNKPTQFSAPGETASQFGTTLAEQAAKGLRPVSISVTEVNDVAYISTVYEKADVGSVRIHAGLTPAGYGTEFNANAAAGRSLQWVESHVEDGQVRIAAIWYEKLTGPYLASGVRTTAQMRSDLETNTTDGSYTRSLTGYYVDRTFSYLALWRAEPESTITKSPPKQTSSTKAKIVFSSSDPFATQECRLDNKGWKPCRNEVVYKKLKWGKHTVRIRATSREGVTEPVPAKASWKVVLS